MGSIGPSPLTDECGGFGAEIFICQSQPPALECVTRFRPDAAGRAPLRRRRIERRKPKEPLRTQRSVDIYIEVAEWLRCRVHRRGIALVNAGSKETGRFDPTRCMCRLDPRRAIVIPKAVIAQPTFERRMLFLKDRDRGERRPAIALGHEITRQAGLRANDGEQAVPVFRAEPIARKPRVRDRGSKTYLR